MRRPFDHKPNVCVCICVFALQFWHPWHSQNARVSRHGMAWHIHCSPSPKAKTCTEQRINSITYSLCTRLRVLNRDFITFLLSHSLRNLPSLSLLLFSLIFSSSSYSFFFFFSTLRLFHITFPLGNAKYREPCANSIC